MISILIEFAFLEAFGSREEYEKFKQNPSAYRQATKKPGLLSGIFGQKPATPRTAVSQAQKTAQIMQNRGTSSYASGRLRR